MQTYIHLNVPTTHTRTQTRMLYQCTYTFMCMYVHMHKHFCIVKFWHNTHTRAHILFYIPPHRHSINVCTHVNMYTADRDSTRQTSLDVSETRCASHTTIPVTFSAGTRSVNKSTTMMRDVIAITPPMIVTRVMCQPQKGRYVYTQKHTWSAHATEKDRGGQQTWIVKLTALVAAILIIDGSSGPYVALISTHVWQHASKWAPLW